jgi:DNA-directed RNA polymerase subunit RPC12/RpoP
MSVAPATMEGIAVASPSRHDQLRASAFPESAHLFAQRDRCPVPAPMLYLLEAVVADKRNIVYTVKQCSKRGHLWQKDGLYRCLYCSSSGLVCIPIAIRWLLHRNIKRIVVYSTSPTINFAVACDKLSVKGLRLPSHIKYVREREGFSVLAGLRRGHPLAVQRCYSV